MPPLIVWALGAAGAALLARVLAKESRRINEELHGPAAESADPVEPAQQLRRDTATGVYRPE